MQLTWANDKRLLCDLVPWEQNPKQLTVEQADRLVDSLDTFGQVLPICIDPNNVIIDGHQRQRAWRMAQQYGNNHEVDVRVASRVLTEREQQKLTVYLDKARGEWDYDLLANYFDPNDLLEWGFTEGELGWADDTQQEHTPLTEQFLVPPFSLLDGRQGYWRERKKAWLALGIQSELGRGQVQASLGSARKTQTGKGEAEGWVTTSVFDPVLCEAIYTWFVPEGGRILDPFAGGSVRGVVAGHLGRNYTGIELRQEQVDENRAQAVKIGVQATWYVGDSANLDNIVEGEFDFVFSCPPYYDLEVYSQLDGELSAVPTYDEFIEAYHDIIAKACAKLKPNSFACFVVGDIRDKAGNYRNFVADTIRGFLDAGLHLYNEFIFATPVGTLPVRAGKVFKAGRKAGKAHQNVLVFVKGTGKQATQRLGDITITREL